MQFKKFEWKPGSKHKTNADVAGKVCTDLEAKGALNASNLVEVSRPKSAPLHNEFEWRNTIAAENWRCHQARNIINALTFTIVKTEEDPSEESVVLDVQKTAEPTTQVRAFFKLDTESSGNYESLQTILANEEKSDSLLQMALKEFTQFRNKYQTVRELIPLFQAFDEINSD